MFCRLSFVACGVWWVRSVFYSANNLQFSYVFTFERQLLLNETGKRAPASKAPIRTIAPHSTMFDVSSLCQFPWTGTKRVSPVARSDMAKIWPLKVGAAILIDRSSKDSRKYRAMIKNDISKISI